MSEPEETLPIIWATRKRATSQQEAAEALAHLWLDEPQIFHPETCDAPSSQSLMDEARLYAKEWKIPFSPRLLKAMYAQVLADEDPWEQSD